MSDLVAPIAHAQAISFSNNLKIYVPVGATGYDVLPWTNGTVIENKAAFNGITLISLSETSLSLVAGSTSGKATASLTASILPASLAKSDVTWKSSNTKVATVSGSGNTATVTAVGNGTAVITATAGKKNATCLVTVSTVLSGIAIGETVKGKTADVDAKTLTVGMSCTLVPMFTPAGVSNKNVSWTSSNPNVATVSQAGKITAISAGSATITLTGESVNEAGSTLSDSCAVTVADPATGVALDPKSFNLGMGETVVITANVYPRSAITSNLLTWSVNSGGQTASTETSDTAQAGAVKLVKSADGLSATLTGMSIGRATVSAIASDTTQKKASCSLNVGNAVPSDFTIAGRNNAAFVAVGKTLQISPVWGGQAPVQTGLSWSVANKDGAVPPHATISQKGVLKGLSAGSVLVKAVSAASTHIEKTLEIEIYEPVKSVSLNAASLSLSTAAGSANSAELSVIPNPADATGIKLSDGGLSVEWAIDPKYASAGISLSAATGISTTVSVPAGTAEVKNIPVTAKVSAYNNYTKTLTCKVSVSANPNILTKLKLSKNSATVRIGTTLQLTAATTPVNPDGGKGVNWSVSEGSSFVSVSGDGLVTPLAPGTAVVAATSAAKDKNGNPITAYCRVTVPAAVTGLSFTNTARMATWYSSGGTDYKQLAVGKSFTFNVSKMLSDGKTASSNADLIWEVLGDGPSPGEAEITQKGAVKGVSEGNVIVKATSLDGKYSTQFSFRVYVPVTGVALDKAKLTLGTDDACRYGTVYVGAITPLTATDQTIAWVAANKNVQLAKVSASAAASTGSFSDADVSFQTAETPTGAVITAPGEYLALKAVTPGVTKLTGRTMDRSGKKVYCTVTIRGKVTGMALKEVEKSVGGVTADKTMTASLGVPAYQGNLKAGGSVTLVPLPVINGVAYSESTKTVYNSYKKYTDASVSYISANPAVATVNKNGQVSVKRGVGAGATAKITVKSADGGSTAVFTVTVVN